MFTGRSLTTDMSEPTTYEIRVRDVLDDKWETHFAPFSLTASADGTCLTGVVHDQAELLGVILKVRDLGLRLVSVNPVARP